MPSLFPNANCYREETKIDLGHKIRIREQRRRVDERRGETARSMGS